MSTLSQVERDKISAYLADHVLPQGLGSEESACSIAAINLSLYGRLTDEIPACMSLVIGRWIIRVQDAMPHEMRNSNEWKRLLPLAAGTGRDHEQERKDIVLDWMWRVVLPYLLPLAEKQGFGQQWQKMCDEKTDAAAANAYADANAANAAANAYADANAAAADAANAANAAANAYAAAAANAAASANAADADADAAYAAYAAASSYAASADADAAYAAYAAASAAAAAAAAAANDGDDDAWTHFNPCDLLKRLIAVGDES